MKSKYDVIIVGGGPAGIFAALELSQAVGLKVLILEKGKDLDSRHCPILGKKGDCRSCSPCSSVSGLGGAGAFSDGKMTLSNRVGGHLRDYLGEEKSRELISYVDEVYLRFGATDELYGVGEKIEQISHQGKPGRVTPYSGTSPSPGNGKLPYYPQGNAGFPFHKDRHRSRKRGGYHPCR